MFSVYSHYKQNTRVTWRRSTWHYTSNSYIHIVLYFKFIHRHGTILQIQYTILEIQYKHFKYSKPNISNTYIDMVLYLKYSIPYLKYSTNKYQSDVAAERFVVIRPYVSVHHQAQQCVCVCVVCVIKRSSVYVCVVCVCVCVCVRARANTHTHTHLHSPAINAFAIQSMREHEVCTMVGLF